MKYVILAVMVITALHIYWNYMFKIKELNITSSKIPKAFNGFKILHLSDLHNATYGKENHRLIKAINKENPDAIFYTGDMTDELNFKNNTLYSLIKGIDGKIPGYYIFGNHEDNLKIEDKEELVKALEQAGIKLLNNESAILRKSDDVIYIHGLHSGKEYLRDTYRSNGELRLTKEDLRKYLTPPTEGYNILLAHNPLYGDTYMEAGYDLTLSGHVHGGMVRIPFLGGVLSPDRSFFPKYSKGKYSHSGKTLLVSPGIGGHKARIANPPTIYRIILKTANHL